MRILTTDFLQELFPAPGFIDMRAKGSDKIWRDFGSTIPSAMAFFYKVKDWANVYFGVAARATRLDGTKSNLAYTNALWVDIDEPDAAERLSSSGLPEASIVVASGTPGHLQAYWLLGKPYNLREPDAVALFESYLRGIVRACGGDKACVDASRVLRLPNSRNFKHEPAPYVDIVAWHPEIRYDLEDFPQGEVVASYYLDIGEAVEPSRAVQTEWIRAVLENGYEGQWNPNKSDVDFKVAICLLGEGYAPAETLWLCFNSPAIGRRKSYPERYWRRTVASAVRRLEEQK